MFTIENRTAQRLLDAIKGNMSHEFWSLQKKDHNLADEYLLELEEIANSGQSGTIDGEWQRIHSAIVEWYRRNEVQSVLNEAKKVLDEQGASAAIAFRNSLRDKLALIPDEDNVLLKILG